MQLLLSGCPTTYLQELNSLLQVMEKMTQWTIFKNSNALRFNYKTLQTI